MLCPICQKPSNPDLEPFCSQHCKNVDLLRWINEDYKIPTQEPVSEEGQVEEDEEH